MIVLASASPRRRRLLTEAGIDHIVRAAQVDESFDSALSPEAVVLLLAERKVRDVAGREPGRIVLGADTVVVLHGSILGKPADAAEARRILGRLSGRTHRVLTGVFLLNSGTGEHRELVATSCVTFRDLVPGEIDAYVESGEPIDKAGAYGIQGAGSAFVVQLEGSYENVVGLPVEEVRRLLEGWS